MIARIGLRSGSGTKYHGLHNHFATKRPMPIPQVELEEMRQIVKLL